MASLNKIMLIGRLGADCEKKTVDSGDSVANVTLATTEYFKDKSGDRQEKTEWHRLVAWGKTADNMDMMCQKGSQIFVEGPVQTREWTDKDGNKRYTTEVRVYNWQLLSGGRPKDEAPVKQEQSQNQMEIPEDDDSPF